MSEEVPIGEQIRDLENQLSDLQARLTLSDQKQKVAELDSDISGLPAEVAELRARGYRFKSYLEQKVATLKRHWIQAKSNAQREIAKQETALKPLYQEAERQMGLLRRQTSSPSQAAAQLAPTAGKISRLETGIETAERTVASAYETVRGNFHQTRRQIEEINWLMDQIEQASFKLLATELPIQAVKAQWWRDGKKKGPQGNLYLTDQRLIFEQKEKVATKKVLFIATEKESLQEMLFETPIRAVESVKADHKGLGGHQDHLDFTFGSGAPYAIAHFHLDGQDCEMWAGLVNRVQNDEIQRERYYAADENATAATAAMEHALANAPEQCHTCGAAFDTPLAKGQREIKCEYCGNVMRW